MAEDVGPTGTTWIAKTISLSAAREDKRHEEDPHHRVLPFHL